MIGCTTKRALSLMSIEPAFLKNPPHWIASRFEWLLRLASGRVSEKSMPSRGDQNMPSRGDQSGVGSSKGNRSSAQAPALIPRETERARGQVLVALQLKPIIISMDSVKVEAWVLDLVRLLQCPHFQALHIFASCPSPFPDSPDGHLERAVESIQSAFHPDSKLKGSTPLSAIVAVPALLARDPSDVSQQINRLREACISSTECSPVRAAAVVSDMVSVEPRLLLPGAVWDRLRAVQRCAGGVGRLDAWEMSVGCPSLLLDGAPEPSESLQDAAAAIAPERVGLLSQSELVARLARSCPALAAMPPGAAAEIRAGLEGGSLTGLTRESISELLHSTPALLATSREGDVHRHVLISLIARLRGLLTDGKDHPGQGGQGSSEASSWLPAVFIARHPWLLRLAVEQQKDQKDRPPMAPGRQQVPKAVQGEAYQGGRPTGKRPEAGRSAAERHAGVHRPLHDQSFDLLCGPAIETALHETCDVLQLISLSQCFELLLVLSESSTRQRDSDSPPAFPPPHIHPCILGNVRQAVQIIRSEASWLQELQSYISLNNTQVWIFTLSSGM